MIRAGTARSAMEFSAGVTEVVSGVSVAITTRNRSALLERCLHSVVSQTVGPSRVVVSDDASTDGTAAVVAKYQPRFAAQGIQVAYHRHDPPLGQEANRRFAASRGSEELVAFLDDDDCWNREFLQTMTAVMECNPTADLAACGLNLIDGDGQILVTETEEEDRRSGRADLRPGLHTSWLAQHLRGPQFLPINALFRRRCLESIGYVPDRSGLVCDYAIFCVLAAHGYRAFWVPDRLSNYRIHGMGRATDFAITAPADKAHWLFIYAHTVRDRLARQLLLDTSAQAHRAVFLMLANQHSLAGALGEATLLVRRHGFSRLGLRTCALGAAMLCGLRSGARNDSLPVCDARTGGDPLT